MRHSLNEAFAALHDRGAGAGWTKGSRRNYALPERRNRRRSTSAPRASKPDNGGWLHDGCWLRYGEANPLAELHANPGLDCLADAVLILEREGADGGTDLGRIRDDFQKLLVGGARVRRTIWADNKEEDDTEIAEWLVETMSECMETAPDDFYLLARYSDRGFQYWRLQGNGTVYPT